MWSGDSNSSIIQRSFVYLNSCGTEQGIGTNAVVEAMVAKANSAIYGGHTNGIWHHCLLGAEGAACMGPDGWPELDSAVPECLCFPSLLVDGTETLLEPCLSFVLWDLAASQVPEELPFDTTVPSRAVKALEMVDVSGDLVFFRAGSSR